MEKTIMRDALNLFALALISLLSLTGCGPRGLTPTVPLKPLQTHQRKHAVNKQTGRPAGYYDFTETEWRQLDQSPCKFHPASKRAAQLYRRGFSKREIIQSCRDVQPYASGDERQLEQLASFRRSGLPLSDFPAYRSSEESITDWFNKKYIGGQTIAAVGWILQAISTGFIATAAWTLIAHRIRMDRCWANADPWDDMPCEDSIATGVGALVLGGLAVLFAIPGIPMVIVGHTRMRRWLQGRLLDVGHVHDLDTVRLRYLRSSQHRSVHASVAPLVTRGGGGLSLKLQW